MTSLKDWIWNERQQIGKDYESIEEVALYDESHSKFRDLKLESHEILKLIGAKPGMKLLDIGCGTGIFAIEASKKGLDVTAIDVSNTMLEYAKAKANEAEVSITFEEGGFLTHTSPPSHYDLITSSFSFHHLPDFFKFIALDRLRRLIKSDGKLFIQDVIVEQNNYEPNVNQFIDRQESVGGDFLREDAIVHFQEEYSTFDWILEELFRKAGFQIVDSSIQGGLLGRYLCSLA
ncbi:MAG: methyltransferase domain-containing protein [Roseofilum sp. SBFL]|uniref:class I SAM-dependent methyltransferase n=1 Tax=unclassified Roseofilum TaxID=2620099 RepID=UPI001B0A05D0|nr:MULTISPECIES: methyltransferase domain-containing protein [unclassified Roseofilum]MBP0012009.1 methyltransferase domain-containing protein [Roseofilum sp. SID3]MBP0026128.1 methyltransferase domain-containing protein [Roseofilum sp. SID2]MBP0036878.1 methyltransferase domain-containing protein [Roseofilum sp. SID1]MBP0044220.1 methyltransferase domain-containing protein [Roseofilum sp. SBFL]